MQATEQQRIEQQLQQQLQDIYRQVVDADAYLAEMRKQGGAQFTEVFAADSLFDTSSNQFQPYLAETVSYFEKWQQQAQQDNVSEELLLAVVQRMQLLLKTLATLKQVRQST